MALNSKLTIVVAAVIAMSAGFWLSSIQQGDDNTVENVSQNSQDMALAEAKKNYSPIQGVILSPARKIAVPALLKNGGEIFTLDDLTGHWSLIFFGYTHCPDVCPITMAAVAQAKKIAAADDYVFPDVFFVSVDPERDEVEMLAEYVQYFDEDFTGVTGEEGLIKALTLQMSVVYMKMPAVESDNNDSNEGSGNYTMDHSSALLLLNPEGKLTAFLNPPHDPKLILKDVQTVIELSR